MAKSIKKHLTEKRVNIKHLKERTLAEIPPGDLPQPSEIHIVKTGKSNVQEAHKRRGIILNMLLDGYGTPAIIQFGSTEWGIGERQLHKYIKQAKTMIAKFEEKDISNTITWYKAAQKRLFNRCVQRNNLSTASEVLENMAKSRKFQEQIGTAENPVHVIQIVRPDSEQPEEEPK